MKNTLIIALFLIFLRITDSEPLTMNKFCDDVSRYQRYNVWCCLEKQLKIFYKNVVKEFINCIGAESPGNFLTEICGLSTNMYEDFYLVNTFHSCQYNFSLVRTEGLPLFYTLTIDDLNDCVKKVNSAHVQKAAAVTLLTILFWMNYCFV